MMKYEKPEIELIEFQIDEAITVDDNVDLDSAGFGEGVEDDW